MNHHEIPRTTGIEDGSTVRFSTLPPLPQRWDRFLATKVRNDYSYEEITALSSAEYLSYVRNLAVKVITSPDYRDLETNVISDAAYKRLVDGGLLASPLGERNPETRQEEIMAIGRMLSYYDISLGLTFGITTALAIMPLRRFGTPEQQEKYLGMIRNGKRIGLAITERDKSGSAALDMDSNYTDNGDGTITLSFAKHLQGLSGMDGLIVAAVKTGMPKNKTTIGLFIVDKIDIDTKLTQMAGLSGISYGINTGDVIFSTEDHLITELSWKRLLEFQDMFTKSRLLFIGMTLGHQERMEYEANTYALERYIGDTLQAEMEVPQYQLGKIRARSVILDAISRRVAQHRSVNGESLLNTDTKPFVTEANIIKALSAYYAHASAGDRAVLSGGRAFYAGGALQDVNNIWPFRIFEGAELMLNWQIGHDYTFRNQVDNRGLFDRSRTIQNLDKESHNALAKILGTRNITKVHEAIMGQIVSRMFAIGCIDQEYCEPDDFELAKDMLNLEIKQLALEFFSVKTPARFLGQE